MYSPSAGFASSLVLYIILCVVSVWFLWPIIQDVAGRIDNWLLRRRLSYGVKPQIPPLKPWKPMKPHVPLWQFWNPNSGCFIHFLFFVGGFLLFVIIHYLVR